MPEIDEFDKIAEKALLKVNFNSTYDHEIKIIAQALREVHDRAVDECAKEIMKWWVDKEDNGRPDKVLLRLKKYNS